MENLFLTVEQTAERLQISRHSIRAQLRSGSLRGVKRGKLWRVPESALLETPKTTTPNAEGEGPLARALAMVEAQDAARGEVPIRTDGDAASDVRAVREAQTP